MEKKVDYGFGNFHTTYRGLKRISHLGLSAGYRSSLARFPEQEYAFILLANNGEWYNYYLARKLYDFYLAEEFLSPARFSDYDNIDGPKEEEKPIEKYPLDEYQGIFYSPEIITAYSFELDNDSLWIRSIKHRPTLLIPLSKDLLHGDQWMFHRVEFIRDENKVITGCHVWDEEETGKIHFIKLKPYTEGIKTKGK